MEASPGSTRFAPATRLEAVAGGTRAQIIDIGAPAAEPESDIRAQIIDLG